jgi:hypothetical protein
MRDDLFKDLVVLIRLTEEECGEEEGSGAPVVRIEVL